LFHSSANGNHQQQAINETMNIRNYSKDKNTIMLSDLQRGSFKIIGELYKKALNRAGFSTDEFQTPTTDAQRSALTPRCQQKIVFHNTIGTFLTPIPKAYNIALPVHEWDQYPKEWVQKLNAFAEVWVTTQHVQTLLLNSGVSRPINILPPSLTAVCPQRKTHWTANTPFKFLSVGEPHFRKGLHLLMIAYLEAFPDPQQATLTIKTAPSCDWVSPRPDIRILKEMMSRKDLLALYAQFDCYVSASLGEGLGLPIAEAALAELPIATNYWGGHKSLLPHDGFFPIHHQLIEQPFCSDPAYYAQGQQCAFSAPQHIAKTLHNVFESSPEYREQLVHQARKHLISQYGDAATQSKLHERLK